MPPGVVYQMETGLDASMFLCQDLEFSQTLRVVWFAE